MMTAEEHLERAEQLLALAEDGHDMGTSVLLRAQTHYQAAQAISTMESLRRAVAAVEADQERARRAELRELAVRSAWAEADQ